MPMIQGGRPRGRRAAIPPQEKALRAGVEVPLATPGRLLDHTPQNQVRFDHIHILVLDEADRLLDVGFLPDLEHIIAGLPAGGAHVAALRDHAPCATSVEQRPKGRDRQRASLSVRNGSGAGVHRPPV